jgi:hypothetical protein
METILVVRLLALFGIFETLSGANSRGKLRGDDWIINLVSLAIWPSWCVRRCSASWRL